LYLVVSAGVFSSHIAIKELSAIKIPVIQENKINKEGKWGT